MTIEIKDWTPIKSRGKLCFGYTVHDDNTTFPKIERTIREYYQTNLVEQGYAWGGAIRDDWTGVLDGPNRLQPTIFDRTRGRELKDLIRNGDLIITPDLLTCFASIDDMARSVPVMCGLGVKFVCFGTPKISFPEHQEMIPVMKYLLKRHRKFDANEKTRKWMKSMKVPWGYYFPTKKRSFLVYDLDAIHIALQGEYYQSIGYLVPSIMKMVPGFDKKTMEKYRAFLRNKEGMRPWVMRSLQGKLVGKSKSGRKGLSGCFRVGMGIMKDALS